MQRSLAFLASAFGLSAAAHAPAHFFEPVHHSIIVPQETMDRIDTYRAQVVSGAAAPGTRLSDQLTRPGAGGSWMQSSEAFLGSLIETKYPKIFAESSVFGDGSDWNMEELGILGDVSIAVPVTIFDDGRHANPQVHAEPFQGTLVFTPGALLRSRAGTTPADWPELVHDGDLSREHYYGLYKRRLLPVLEFINEKAATRGRALVTIPGLGCGQFAGRFQGRLGSELKLVLERLLTEYGSQFPNIKALYYDPYGESFNDEQVLNGVKLLTRPLTQGQGRPQLSHPSAFGAEFADCELFSIVAWDHVSWPGNDFYIGQRATDDGVKAAATDAMYKLTGVQGHYDALEFKYLRPDDSASWVGIVTSTHRKLWFPEALWRPAIVEPGAPLAPTAAPAVARRSHTIIVPQETLSTAAIYLEELQSGQSTAGNRLGALDLNFGTLEASSLVSALLRTKGPFEANIEVLKASMGWNKQELAILGDVSVAVPVTVYDNGAHVDPRIHDQSFEATLILTPPAMLTTNRLRRSPDYDEVQTGHGHQIDPTALYNLYRRRLLPILKFVNDDAETARSAVITVPGLGCGVFAGQFQGTMGAAVRQVLRRLLQVYGSQLPNIRGIYFDPFNELVNQDEEISGITFLTRPLSKNHASKTQLAKPADLHPSFAGAKLYSIVSWDPVGLPGGQMLGGLRQTDSGVKAAATDLMTRLYRVPGTYAPSWFMYGGMYVPVNADHNTWWQAIQGHLDIWNVDLFYTRL